MDEIDFFAPSAPAASLQDGFKQFLKERKKELKKRKDEVAAIEASGYSGRSEEEMARLRKRFVELCRSYIGIPYGKKYHLDPASPHYNAPLYLDCCALIRKVLRDMKEDIGFNTGPWNQAYQFDTLPNRVDSHEKLIPGDLVFYEGKYVREGAKPQKHDIVHVEVFVGGESGEATVGARWNSGVIQEFESYKFSPKSWSLVRHHFCSIDTWLRGCCKSSCSEHAWQPRTWEPGKKSIFGDGVDFDERDREEEDDEEACPED